LSMHGTHTYALMEVSKSTYDEIASNKVALLKDGRPEIEMHLPANLYDVTEKHRDLVREASPKISKILKEMCGGNKELACAVGLIVAQTVYYTED
jgi:hypothetical protein